jgi:hypothetical protein
MPPQQHLAAAYKRFIRFWNLTFTVNRLQIRSIGTTKQNVKGAVKILVGSVVMGMPPNGYSSVNVPSGLYRRVKALIKARDELGYRSISEFAVEAIRKRTEEIENRRAHLVV